MRLLVIMVIFINFFVSVEAKDNIYSEESKGGWTYKIIITNMGTRSEGYHGILFLDGKEFEGILGDKKETSLGKFEYLGSLEEKAYLWDSSGWMRIVKDSESSITHSFMKEGRQLLLNTKNN